MIPEHSAEIERAARRAILELVFLGASMVERVEAAEELARSCGLEWPVRHEDCSTKTKGK